MSPPLTSSKGLQYFFFYFSSMDLCRLQCLLLRRAFCCTVHLCFCSMLIALGMSQTVSTCRPHPPLTVSVAHLVQGFTLDGLLVPVSL